MRRLILLLLLAVPLFAEPKKSCFDFHTGQWRECLEGETPVSRTESFKSIFFPKDPELRLYQGVLYCACAGDYLSTKYAMAKLGRDGYEANRWAALYVGEDTDVMMIAQQFVSCRLVGYAAEVAKRTGHPRTARWIMRGAIIAKVGVTGRNAYIGVSFSR